MKVRRHFSGEPGSGRQRFRSGSASSKRGQFRCRLWRGTRLGSSEFSAPLRIKLSEPVFQGGGSHDQLGRQRHAPICRCRNWAVDRSDGGQKSLRGSRREPREVLSSQTVAWPWYPRLFQRRLATNVRCAAVASPRCSVASTLEPSCVSNAFTSRTRPGKQRLRISPCALGLTAT